MSATGAAVSHPAGDAAVDRRISLRIIPLLIVCFIGALMILAGVLTALVWPFRELGYSRQ
jgi:hypothetical protein